MTFSLVNTHPPCSAFRTDQQNGLQSAGRSLQGALRGGAELRLKAEETWWRGSDRQGPGEWNTCPWWGSTRGLYESIGCKRGAVVGGVSARVGVVGLLKGKRF